jgi:hypothetical protein
MNRLCARVCLLTILIFVSDSKETSDKLPEVEARCRQKHSRVMRPAEKHVSDAAARALIKAGNADRSSSVKVKVHFNCIIHEDNSNLRSQQAIQSYVLLGT